MKITATALRLTAVAATGAGLCLAGSVTGASARPIVPASSTPTAGDLLYLDPSGAVDAVTVSTSGATSEPNQVGPVSIPTGSEKVAVDDLVGSGDGAWAAWAEQVTKSIDQPDVSDLLVARNNNTGAEFMVKTLDEPVGFAGHVLVVSNGLGAFKLVLTPKPHLVSIHDRSDVVATYRKGVVDDPPSAPHPDNPAIASYEHLRLHSFSGAKRVLHVYTDRATGQKIRNVEVSTVSGDSLHLLVERGDHTDFGGNGPSSAVDEFSLTGAPHRKQLGHYGTGAAQWRVATETYVGASDQPWVTWYSAHTAHVKSVVARYVGGHWQLVANHAVAAEGNLHGYVVVQPGSFTLVANSPANQHVPTPSGDAVLVHNGHQHALGIEATEFVWISKVVVLV